jgi:predicted DNA-binding protein YlxM (UPF0122 family)
MTEERLKEILRMYDANYSVKEIAQRFDCNADNIRLHIKKYRTLRPNTANNKRFVRYI